MNTIAPDASSVCLSCGMCCDGTLFERAKAQPGELDRLEANGIRSFEAEGRTYFRLGCPRLSGTCCTIYEDRFTICRTFRCRLLAELESGAETLEGALETVRVAKRLLDKVRLQRPEAVALRERAAVADEARHWNTLSEPGERRRAAQLYLDIAALERHLNARFRKKDKEGPSTEKF